MKRLGAFFTAVLMASLIVGCGDEGIKEGMPTTTSPEDATKGMRAIMEKDAANMQLKGKTGPPAESKKAAEAAAKEKQAQTP